MGQARRQRDADRRADRVVLATISPGQMSTMFFTSVVATLFYERATKDRVANVLQEWSSANISEARNKVTARFLERDDADWLWWVDSDMSWDPATALDLMLETADPESAPVVGGLCFGGAGGRLYPTIYTFMAAAEGEPPVMVRADDYPRDSVVPVTATGAAFLLVHRRVLEAIRDAPPSPLFSKTWPWFQETEIAGRVVGEDITFCVRAAALGFPVFVDTRVKVGHHKSVVFTEDMFLAEKGMGA